jgi:hypothetical protein
MESTILPVITMRCILRIKKHGECYLLNKNTHNKQVLQNKLKDPGNRLLFCNISSLIPI